VRHVEPVVAAEGEAEVVARDARDLARLEAEQLADAVVLVNDVVAGAQVGEGLESAPDRSGAPDALAENLRVREEHEPQLAPDETPARGTDGEEELRLLGQPVARVDNSGLDPPEHVFRAERLTLVREGDDHPLPGPHEGPQLVLRLSEPARGHRRPLRLEGERLPGRERVELRGALERELGVELLAPDGAHLVRLPDDVGAAGNRRDEIVRDYWPLSRRGNLPVPPDPLPWSAGADRPLRERLDKVEPTLRGRIDDRTLDRMQRPLRERREGADRLDLVAEELDAERVPPGRGEDVEEAAADGELPPLVDLLDALVAGEREPLGEVLHSDVLADPEPDRLGPRLRWRRALGESGGRRTDEPAARQHL
jgi:hypothetical protein